MKKKLLLSAGAIFAGLVIWTSGPALAVGNCGANAQLDNNGLCIPITQGTAMTTDVNTLLLRVINVLLGVAFLVAVLYLIIGGYKYIMSNGNEKSAEEGKKTVINALIGIVIIILAFVIVQVVAKTVSSGFFGF